jgi:c-di-GMP-related signal transduction protein
MQVFVARQPIFDRQKRVFGYEILYRSTAGNFYDGTDGDLATRKVIANTFLHIGVQRLTGGKKAFINFTQNLLIEEVAFNLPKNLVIIEILEDVMPDQDLIQVCRKFHDAGYTLALDDYLATNEHLKPLAELAGILKVDFRGNDDQQKKVIAEWVRTMATNPRLLAEKVETQEEFQMALENGYEYFQGFFFSKPEIIPGKDVPGFKLNHLKMLQELQRKDLHYGALEETIKRDLSLSYKLLNYINSAYFGVRQQVSSVRHAIMLLGEDEVRRWASLVVLTGLGKDKPQELLVTSLIRANFCEALAEQMGWKGKKSELYMIGLLSLLDVFVGRPLAEVLAEMPLSQEIKAALSAEKTAFRSLLDLVLYYERADFTELQGTIENLNLKPEEIAEVYLDSVTRAEQALGLQHV